MLQLKGQYLAKTLKFCLPNVRIKSPNATKNAIKLDKKILQSKAELFIWE